MVLQVNKPYRGHRERLLCNPSKQRSQVDSKDLSGIQIQVVTEL